MLPTPIRLPLAIAAVTLLTACGPETNSRYGDSYWDPWTTKDTFDPVEAPQFRVEYYDVSDEADPPEYEARISLDASETNERLISYSWGFIRGTREYTSLEPLGESLDYLTYLQDPDDPSEDNRLTATVAGEYRIVFTGELIGPLGKTTLTFDDMAFTLPGCPTTFSYYADYLDETLQTCSNCHNTGDAGAALSLPSNNFNNRRQNFLSYVSDDVDEDPTEQKLPHWIINLEHPGNGTLTADSQEYDYFRDFIDIVDDIKAETGDAALATANNSGGDGFPQPFCINEPEGFEVVEES
ncbi:MAG: hypothetical protein ACX931_11825 [Saccharospirillum sp.]